MLFHQLPMGRGVVPDPTAGIAIVGVALDDGPSRLLDHLPPKFRRQEILVAFLPGMDLNRDFPRQRNAEGLIKLDDVFRGDFPNKIDFGFRFFPPSKTISKEKEGEWRKHLAIDPHRLNE